MTIEFPPELETKLVETAKREGQQPDEFVREAVERLVEVKQERRGAFEATRQRAASAWISQHAHEYPGDWVALNGNELIAHGPVLKDVGAAAKAAGYAEPLFAHLPEADELPFGGW